MAATEWILDDWTIAQWTDETQTAFLFFLWKALKLASDERQAFIEQVFNTSFDADKEFPDYGDIGITLQGVRESPDFQNNMNRVINALSHTDGTEFDIVDDSAIAADGTTVSSSVFPDYLQLGDILTDILGYPDTKLLMDMDTTTTALVGTHTAIWQMSWLKQLYEVMNYPQYYARQIINTIDSFFSVIEQQDMRIGVNYKYKHSLAPFDPDTFDSASADYVNPPSSTTNLYISGDLNESAPFSTPQDVWDYSLSLFDGKKSSALWQTISDATAVDPKIEGATRIRTDGDHVNMTDFGPSVKRIRFKMTDSKRSVSPTTYITILKYYLCLYSSFTAFNSFGVGVDELETKLLTMTPDAGDYYYMESVTAPDFTLMNVPSLPSPIDDTTDNIVIEDAIYASLNPQTKLHFGIEPDRTDILVEANNSDGTAFEYYTP